MTNSFQETKITSLKQNHDRNLSFISSQLFELQRNLIKKEKYLSQLIKEREQVGMVEIIFKFLQNLNLADNTGTTKSYQTIIEKKFIRYFRYSNF